MRTEGDRVSGIHSLIVGVSWPEVSKLLLRTQREIEPYTCKSFVVIAFCYVISETHGKLHLKSTCKYFLG